MRIYLTLFSLLLFYCTANSQKLTGIWRGYFCQSPISSEGEPRERYKYEIQLEQLANNSLSGVTYSYKSTVFYGKAALKGIIALPAKSLILKETRLIELKVSSNTSPCLMTCYLDYVKMGKLEMLQGSFMSEIANDKSDCGSGDIYLEKVPDSDFRKEDFLVKKIDTTNIRPLAKHKPSGGGNGGATGTPNANNLSPRGDNPSAKPNSIKPPSAQKKAQPSDRQKNNLVKSPPQITPKTGQKEPAKDQLKNNSSTSVSTLSEKSIPSSSPPQKELIVPQQIEKNIRHTSIPTVLLERENTLIKTITVTEANITIELYDNGTIDNDIISLYHNNEKVVSNGRLVYTPLSLKIQSSKEHSRHELVIVAENLGDIAPNTALMVIKAGHERYEVILASNEHRNAKVVINYLPKKSIQ